MSDLPSVISRPNEESTSFAGGILTAAAPTGAYTTLTQSVIVVYTGADGTSVRTTQRILTVTDAAEFSSLATQSATASTISSTASKTATKTSAATSSAAADKPSTTTSILIPAIVAPVAAILVITFVFFWWFMRRRAKQAVKNEPEFVMEKRNEKSFGRDDSSTHSHSSTRKLVTKAESIPVNKEPVPNVKEIETASFDLFPAERRSSVSRGGTVPFIASPTQPLWHSRQSSNASHNPSGPPLVPAVAVRNFSRGPSRPGTASKDGGPGFSQFSRDGSLSSPGLRPHTAGNDRSRNLPARGPSPNTNRSEYNGPLPFANNASRPDSPSIYEGPGPASRDGPRPPPSALTQKDRSQYQQPRRIQPHPAPIQTNRQHPQRMNPPTPTGAYNGASPISQYSPIIKDGPAFNTSPIARVLAQSTSRKEPPSAINTNNTTNVSSQSSDFSEENMRIARLADSSRLGFYPTNSSKPTTTNTATHSTISSSTPNTVDPPNPSPRLPPPATRDAPPSRTNIPIPPPPPEPITRMPLDSHRTDSFAPDNRRSTRSMVSRLSSDDDYIDDEIDSKSEVSSLDEGERWQMQQDHDSRSGSRLATSTTTNGIASGTSHEIGNGNDESERTNPFAGFNLSSSTTTTTTTKPLPMLHSQASNQVRGMGSPSDAGSSTYSLGRF